jgi:hypothetical protein
MAIAHVAAWTAAQFNNVSTGTNTARASTTNNFMAVGVTINNNALFSSIATTSNTLTQRAPASGWQNTGGDSIRIYAAEGITGAASHTVTVNTSSNAFFVVCASEYSGLATSGAFDQIAGAGVSGAGTSFDSGATPTTTRANELLVGYGDQDAGGNGSFVAGASFNVRSSIGTAASGSTGALEDRIVSATGAYNGLMSSSGFTGPTGWDMLIATFADVALAASNTEFGSRTNIPNPHVGPMTLRQGWRQPPIYAVNLAPITDTNFGPPTRVPNNRVGPVVLRQFYRRPSLSFDTTNARSAATGTPVLCGGILNSAIVRSGGIVA